MMDPSDDHRGNSGAPSVPGTMSRREDPSVASSQSPLGMVWFADSFWLKLSVAASHRPSGEQAGQIQLRAKSSVRLWKTQSGGPVSTICLPMLTAWPAPTDTAISEPQEERKSRYGSTGSNTFTQGPPDEETASS